MEALNTERLPQPHNQQKARKSPDRKISWKYAKKQKVLLLMSIPIMLYLVLFRYVPLWGWVAAFKDYKVGHSMWKADWVGFGKFSELFRNDEFLFALRNTFVLNFMSLIVGTVAAVGLAVMLNELRSKFFVRSVQTMTYLPHFVSIVVVANIATMLLAKDDGLINVLLTKFGFIDDGVFFFGHPKWYWVLQTIIMEWKGFGYNAIIYLAAIAGIDLALYEAAHVDGATRWHRIRHITLPSIMPVVILMSILGIGHLAASGLEAPFLLGNIMTREYSDVIAIVALRQGLQGGDFSFGVAVSIFESSVSIVLLYMVNTIARRYQANIF